jgi:hypothetical protein
MSGPGRRFDPAELHGDGVDVTDAELADSLAMARELEALSARDQIGPTPGFEDRVMGAIATEAPPRLVVRQGGRVRPLAFVAAFGDAWRVATGGGRPIAVRAQAMAFVLLVVLATGSLASVAAIGAANLLSSPPGPAPTIAPAVDQSPTPTPSVTPTQVSPSPSPSPDATSSDDPAVGETDDPGASDDHGVETAEPENEGSETAKPATTPKPTKTPRPTRTPRAEETDEPEETPEPDETPDDDTSDDHGGSGPG